MKKILAIALTGVLVLGGSAAAASATVNGAPAVQAEAVQNVLYLVPGTYVSGGQKVENTIASGAEKLTAAECDNIHTENAYACSLSEGAALPVPVSERTDKNGVPYSFNGWWTIVDATVTYFDSVPALSETTFLYADWRADLSQRKDPVKPDESTDLKPVHYMSVTHGDTAAIDIIPMNVSGTDSSEACDLGYGAPVQIYNEWFELAPNDEITVYTVGIADSEDPVAVPVTVGGKRTITLEKSALEKNDTADYLTVAGDNTKVVCKAETSRHYRIYVKFYDSGSAMTIYMQPKD